MKKLQQFLKCISGLIKKKFFISDKDDIYQECKELPGINKLVDPEDNDTEEYLATYNSTTRWQTV